MKLYDGLPPDDKSYALPTTFSESMKLRQDVSPDDFAALHMSTGTGFETQDGLDGIRQGASWRQPLRLLHRLRHPPGNPDPSAISLFQG